VTDIPYQESLAQQARKRSKAPADGNVLASRQIREDVGKKPPPLPSLRFEIPEAAQILRMSRAALYLRISSGAIKAQKDGARTYITRAELERYVSSCD
jgi:hypothetical protein